MSGTPTTKRANDHMGAGLLYVTFPGENDQGWYN